MQHTCVIASMSGHLRILQHTTFILFLVHRDSVSAGMKTENASIFLLSDTQAFIYLSFLKD